MRIYSPFLKKSNSEFPRFVHDMLACPPKHGSGVHGWLFRTARVLHPFRAHSEIFQILEASVVDCGRHVPPREIRAAIKDSKKCAWQPGRRDTWTAKPRPKWPPVNHENVRGICKEGLGLVDLWEASPIRVEVEKPEPLIEALFPGNPLLCIGKSAREFDARPLADWPNLSQFSFVVPSPMTAVSGTTKDGKESRHCLDNTGPRRFLVCEFDSGDFDEHAAILWHLRQYAPFGLAVHSAGKSLHGWFNVADWPSDRTKMFFRYAVSLGADPRMWTRSQFARLPEGRRDNGRRQNVYYFNPDLIS